MNFLKNIVFDFTSQIDAATSDPVVKLLVISLIALIVMVVIILIIKSLNSFFHILFKPKQKEKHNKKTKSIQESTLPQNTSSSDQKMDDIQLTTDNHLQEAQALLDNLNKITSSPAEASPSQDTFSPIVIDNNRVPYSGDVLNGTDYTPAEEEIKQIEQTLFSLSSAEVGRILMQAKNSAQALEASLETNQKKYLKLVNEYNSSLSSEKSSIEEFNQEVFQAKQEINEQEQRLQTFIQRLVLANETLSKLISAEIEARETIQQLRLHLIEQSAETKKLVDEYQSVSLVVTSASSRIKRQLSERKHCVEKLSLETDNNKEELLLVSKTIANDKRKVSLEQKKIEVATVIYTTKQAEEAAKIAEAEQKARDEAERKAAEEAAKRAEEARLAKIVAQQQAAEEAARKAEEERLAAAEAERKAVQLASQSIDTTRPLTPEEEAAQAKAMMDAQRERRRQQAAQKKAQKNESDSDESRSSNQALNDNLPRNSSDKDEKEIIQNFLNTSESVSNEQNNNNTETSDEPTIDPMIAIRAEWDREKKHKEKFAAEKKAREAEIARRTEEMQAESKASTTSNKHSST